MQPFGCMLASKDGGSPNSICLDEDLPDRCPSRLAQPKRLGSHLKVTVNVSPPRRRNPVSTFEKRSSPCKMQGLMIQANPPGSSFRLVRRQIELKDSTRGVSGASVT